MADITTAKRLADIERELAERQEEYTALRARWEQEKSGIQELRSLKEQIEQVKAQAAESERSGDYARVAELRYGTLLALQKQLDTAQQVVAQTATQSPLLKEEIGAEDIAEIVAKWTGIPVQRMMESERTKLLNMDAKLQERVIGQEHAVAAVSSAIRRSRAGLSDTNKPSGSFIFIGSTGVGKTEMAKALAEFLFDDEHALVRIDMSEYMEKHSVSRLIGAPPGYVGYEEGGQLTEAIRVRPYSVILLDEIEKAHHAVLNVLLQVLDDGRLTDGQGRIVDFKNTIIIMTSNLGSEALQESIGTLSADNREQLMSEFRTKVTEVLRKELRPEFLNRIDDVIVFQPLLLEEVELIARLQLDSLTNKLREHNISLVPTENAIEWLAKRGYDPQYGARPLKRVIQRYVADPLSIKLLSGEVQSQERIILDSTDSGQMTFTSTPSE